MNRIFIFIGVFTFANILFLTHYAQASVPALYTEIPSQEIKAGDKLSLKVYLDTDGAELNVIEGTVRILGDVTILGASTDGSVFNIWPAYPDSHGNEISFTGGTPANAVGKKLLAFTVSVVPQQVGSIQFEVLSLQGYLDDGKGTMLAGTSTKSAVIPIRQSAGNVSSSLWVIYLVGLFMLVCCLVILYNKRKA